MDEVLADKFKRKPKQKHTLTDKQAAYMAAKDCCGKSIIPESKQTLLRKAYEGVSLRAAIKAMCCDCYGWETMADVGKCPSESCPLWPNRPFQKKDDPEDDEE